MEIPEIPKDKKILLFDGVCNLCNFSVKFVIEHDKKDIFRFVSLQSKLGINILNQIGIEPLKVDSIVLYEPGKAYYIKARVVFEILREISGIARLLMIFSILPKSFLDYIYDYIANNRYLWFGKKESCMIPSAELRSKFFE